MVWRRIGDKPLSEPMLARLTHICGTRWRWINIKSKHHKKNIKTQKAHYGFEYFQINPRVERATFSEKKTSRYNSFFFSRSPSLTLCWYWSFLIHVISPFLWISLLISLCISLCPPRSLLISFLNPSALFIPWYFGLSIRNEFHFYDYE